MVPKLVAATQRQFKKSQFWNIPVFDSSITVSGLSGNTSPNQRFFLFFLLFA